MPRKQSRDARHKPATVEGRVKRHQKVKPGSDSKKQVAVGPSTLKSPAASESDGPLTPGSSTPRTSLASLRGRKKTSWMPFGLEVTIVILLSILIAAVLCLLVWFAYMVVGSQGVRGWWEGASPDAVKALKSSKPNVKIGKTATTAKKNPGTSFTSMLDLEDVDSDFQGIEGLTVKKVDVSEMLKQKNSNSAGGKRKRSKTGDEAVDIFLQTLDEGIQEVRGWSGDGTETNKGAYIVNSHGLPENVEQ